MSAQNKLFQRLFWLVDTIYSAGPISRDELDRRWARSACNDAHESRYPERTFHRHRETIFEMLGIEIVCDHTTREYTLNFLDDVTTNGVRQMLLDSLALNNTVNLAGELRDHSIFSFHLAPTYDFIQELRKHGPNLEVLAPESLRDAFRIDAEQQLKHYALP